MAVTSATGLSLIFRLERSTERAPTLFVEMLKRVIRLEVEENPSSTGNLSGVRHKCEACGLTASKLITPSDLVVQRLFRIDVKSLH